MLDHISLGVRDLERAALLYDAALSALGYVRLFTHPRAIGYGPPGDKDEPFALLHAPGDAPLARAGSHVAFAAPNREAVMAFHAAALAAGAVDDGAPGPRPQYGAGYYAAFVIDRDGHRLEAVVHEPV